MAIFHTLLLHFTQGAGHNPVGFVEKYEGPNALPARGWILMAGVSIVWVSEGSENLANCGEVK